MNKLKMRDIYLKHHDGFQFFCDDFEDEMIKTFGTPSITKEQLLAILPEKKSCPRHSITDNDFTNDGDLCDCCTSFKGFNEAIDQLKQRIEEL